MAYKDPAAAKANAKAHYEKNKELYILRAKKRRENDPEHANELGRKRKAIRMRTDVEFREKNRAHARKFYAENREKVLAKKAEYNKSDAYKAQKQVRLAIQRGELVRPSFCSQCGTTEFAIEAHHEDYSRQLDVVWLCTLCHGARHSK
jgi:hypothetical protein